MNYHQATEKNQAAHCSMCNGKVEMHSDVQLI